MFQRRQTPPGNTKINISHLQHILHSQREGERAQLALQTVLQRLRWVAGVFRAIQRYGRGARKSAGIGLTRQFLQLLKLTFVNGYHPAQDYYRYRMYQFEDAASVFLPSPLHFEIRDKLYDELRLDPARLADKRLFYKHCETLRFPVPETIADFAAGEIHWWCEPHLPQDSLFSKEAASMAGAGASLWIRDGASGWRTPGGKNFNEKGVIEHLQRMSSKAPIVLQRNLANHPDIEDLGPSGLCTVRLLTIRFPETASEILAATFRMTARGGIADNFTQGGMASPVDIGSGLLGPAVCKTPSFMFDIMQHPDTGGQISGRTLPFWKDVTSLALNAHTAFLEFPSVGWDISITPRGPVLVEGNYDWGAGLVQQPGCRPLGTTRYPEHVLAWLSPTK